MPQLNYRPLRIAEAFAGMLDSSKMTGDVRSAINDDPRAAQIITFTVAAESTSATLTLLGIEFSGAGANINAVAADLVAEINAEPLVNGSLIAEADTADVIVTAKIGGIPFSYAAGTNTTAAVTQANATSAPIPFGRAVLLSGESDEGDALCKLVDANKPAAIFGISVYTATFEKSRPDSAFERNPSQYPPNSIVNVLREGRIFVETEAAVSVGDSVYVRHTADGALDQLGGFAGDSGTGLAELTNCKWVRGSNSDGLAVLQVQFV